MFLFEIYLFVLTFSPANASDASFEKINFSKRRKRNTFWLSDGTSTDGESDMEREEEGGDWAGEI